MSSSNQKYPDYEPYMKDGGTPSGTSALVSSFLPSHNVSVYNPSRPCMMRVLHGAANQHSNFTPICTSYNQKITCVHGVTLLDASSLNNTTCSRTTLPERTRAHIAHTSVKFSAPTSCQTDTPVSTVHSQMYPSHDIGHELYNFNFTPIVHSKVKSASLKSRYAAIVEPEPEMETYLTKDLPRNNEPFRLVKPAVCGTLACNEPVGLCNPAFHGNNIPIESEIYLTKNLENYRTMSYEP